MSVSDCPLRVIPAYTKSSCITALSHSSNGILVLPTTIQLCTALAKLAMTLDKRPDLTRRLRAGADEESRKSLVESTAETIQRAFTICLTERTSNRDGVKDDQPESKKIGIYSFANLVLKLLFRCHKTPLAEQLFTNIMQNSPPLALYPASHRVTYLYYLGRFYFSNTHFYKAQLCLQAAYDQCHRQCLKQRETILVYLITVNILLGRYPGTSFMSRPEAPPILQRFAPVVRAMRRGDLASFKHALSPESPNHNWFFDHGILLPLLYRGEVLVWRSLARKCFVLTYEEPTDRSSRKAPTLDLNAMVTAAQMCQKILDGTAHGGQRKKLKPSEGVIHGNMEPNMQEIESVAASLVSQDLIHGFLSHNLKRFAILGSKQRGGPLNAGFSEPWPTMRNRAEEANMTGGEMEVSGWVTKVKSAGEFGLGLGGLVNLSGIARPVGST